MSSSRASCPEPGTGWPARARAALCDDGPLARHHARFSERPGQQEFAERIAEVFRDGGALLAEAGTGTGKTLAYTVPALLAAADGARVVLSTGTRTLQDQLFRRDLPLCREALELPVRVALLKGRSNYLCLHRLQRAVDDGRWASRQEAAALREAQEWASATSSGDLAEASPAVRSMASVITATPEQCLGGECPAYADCLFFKARNRAFDADIVVVNHHLLLADWAVKDAGYGAVLPPADAIVLDEAHQLPDTAGRFFGRSVTTRALTELLRDTRAADRREAGDLPALGHALAAAEDALERARGSLTEQAADGLRGPWPPGEACEDALFVLREALAEVSGVLEQAAGRGVELDRCRERAAGAVSDLEAFTEKASDALVRWYEGRGGGFALHATPLDVGGGFRKRLEREASSWVLTSATLTVDGSFQPIQRRLGLEDTAATFTLPSPFDYPRHSLLYLPEGLPRPGAPGYDHAVLEKALPIIEAAPGGAFVLFTSHRALRSARGFFADRLERPLLAQGDASQASLLERFAAAGNAVLLGTASFWEGVDVPGPALSTVVIDRLPFASPKEPVTEARMAAAEQRGESGFQAILLPEAVIALKQGAGRLIRDEEDSGVLMVADPRLTSQPYGKAFLRSVPPMSIVRSAEEVEAFWGNGGRTPSLWEQTQ